MPDLPSEFIARLRTGPATAGELAYALDAAGEVLRSLSVALDRLGFRGAAAEISEARTHVELAEGRFSKDRSDGC